MRYKSILFSLVFGIVTLTGQVRANEDWSHSTALTGEPRYEDGFAHFDYVNPDAPKAGKVRLATQGSFDSFNPIAEKGERAAGLGYVYETLMVSSLDELNTSAMYGLLASETKHAGDYSWVSFRLNENAKWQDGEPVTVDDVIWSFEKAVELNPLYKFYYRNVVEAERTGEREVTFRFDVTGNRELPHIMGQLTVLPKHWWEGTGPDGNKRDISGRILEPPMGSGPYMVKGFNAGSSVTYKRVDNYWAQTLNVAIGHYNFDEIEYEYYRDPTVMLEAFKGDQFDFRRENSAKNWVTGYEPDRFPAREKGYVVLEQFPSKASGIMQAFVVNLRRDKFSDRRVRRALNLAWDYESAKRTVFFDLYERINSYFAGTELAATGLPEGKELEILETVRTEIPPEVFTEEYKSPVNGDDRKLRANLRKAINLLKEAGYELRDRKMVNAKTGKALTIEYLDNDSVAERFVLPWQQNLKRIGIDLTYRVVDSAQYINRLRSFDFDMITAGWGQSLSPGNEQRNYWGSISKDNPSSRNFAGIADPAIDKLIDRVIFAKDREELVAATRALDRVLLWNEYVIPQFFYPFDRTARWDRFGHPEKLPEFDIGFPDIWWFDEEKAARIK